MAISQADGQPTAIAGPIARERGSASRDSAPRRSLVTTRSYEYIVFDNAARARATRSTYPAATLEQSQATLTVRARLDDAPVTVPASGWEYTSAAGTAIRLLPKAPAATPFQQSAIYEFTYTAKNPVVAGIGLAATRDVVSFLRHAVGGRGQSARRRRAATPSAIPISQPSRTLNDFVLLGFNEDEGGRRVIDGILSWTGGGSGDQINYRFAQTGRTERNRQNHLYPEARVPVRASDADRSPQRQDRRAAMIAATASTTPVPSASRAIRPTSTGSRPARCCTPTRGATT